MSEKKNYIFPDCGGECLTVTTSTTVRHILYVFSYLGVGLTLELQTNVREDLTVTEKAPN